MTVSTELPVATSAFCLPRHRRRAGSSRSPTSMPSPALNRVAEPEALDDKVEALVARIVAKPRVAIALGKALFYRQLEQGMVSAYEDVGATMACNMMDLSALEGVQAFIEKRMRTGSRGRRERVRARGAG